MKHVKIKSTTGVYPVGKNVSVMIEMANVFSTAFKRVEKSGNKKVNVFCRGSSGAMLAALFVKNISRKFSCIIVHVKKDGEDSHATEYSCLSTRSVYDDGINIIIDDFTRSGETLADIYNKVDKELHGDLIVDYLIINDGWGEYSAGNVGFVPKTLISSDDL